MRMLLSVQQLPEQSAYGSHFLLLYITRMTSLQRNVCGSSNDFFNSLKDFFGTQSPCVPHLRLESCSYSYFMPQFPQYGGPLECSEGD